MNFLTSSRGAICFSLLVLFFTPMTGVGAVANEPNCEDPQFQNEMNLCALMDFEEADRELNAAWPEAMASMRKSDEYISPEEGKGRNLLLQAQRLWIKFRDLHCESEAYSSTGGSIYPLLYHSCRAGMTRRRTQQLRDIAAEG